MLHEISFDFLYVAKKSYSLIIRILKQFSKRTGKATESKELIYRSLSGLKCRFTFVLRIQLKNNS